MSARKIFSVVAAGAAIAFVSGCSLLFFGVGALKDASSPDWVAANGIRLVAIKPQTEVTVYKTSGEIVSGRFVKFIPVSETEYRDRYTQFRSQLAASDSFPDWHETLRLSGPSRKPITGQFSGFDVGGRIGLRLAGKPKRAIRWLSLKFYRKIQGESERSYDPQYLLRHIEAWKVPIYSRLRLLQRTGTSVEVDLSEVNLVEVPTSKNAAISGLLIGALVDAGVVLIASSGGGERQTTSTQSESFSCPYVYSFDGENYVLDSEPFGGALFRSAQRTDLDNLHALQEVDGKYRLRVANELPETQYIDRLHLLVVDHLPGSVVVPEWTGQIHVLGSIHPPMAATDSRGNRVDALLQQQDGIFWSDTPLSPRSFADLPRRSGVVLEFSRPPQADSAVLFLRLQNTLWASYLQGHILSFHGDSLASWYGLMNASILAREMFRSVMIREGMLHAQVWDGQAWRPAGFIWEVGPALPKEIALPITLADIQGERLKIRLHATPGLWQIDFVGVAWEEMDEVRITELLPAEALDQNGRDVLALLQRNDHRYYVMDGNDDRAELVFAAPPRLPGMNRSVLLKASGYYHIHVPASGPPQTNMLSRLLSTPGAFAQYAAGLYRKNLHLALEKWRIGHAD